jgi:hypothetical protein
MGAFVANPSRIRVRVVPVSNQPRQFENAEQQGRDDGDAESDGGKLATRWKTAPPRAPPPSAHRGGGGGGAPGGGGGGYPAGGAE